MGFLQGSPGAPGLPIPLQAVYGEEVLHFVLTGRTERNLGILNPSHIPTNLGPWSHAQMILVGVSLSNICLLPCPDALLQLFREIANVWILSNALRGEQTDVWQIVRIENRGDRGSLQDRGNGCGLPPIHAALGAVMVQMIPWAPE
jgi:hypothetical protein